MVRLPGEDYHYHGDVINYVHDFMPEPLEFGLKVSYVKEENS